MRVQTSSLLGEMGEERRVYDRVINIQKIKSEETSPEATAALVASHRSSIPSCKPHPPSRRLAVELKPLIEVVS